MASHASPLFFVRSTSPKLVRKPSTKVISCSTGSFSKSNPCLGHRPRDAIP